MRYAALGLAVVFAASSSATSAQTVGGPLPGPLPLFPPTNWWNLDVSSAPLDPASASYISFIGVNRQVRPTLGHEVSPGSVEIYGFPYVVVSGTQPKKVVTFFYASESDGVGVPFYPIPDEAITQPHWIEGGWPGNQDHRGSNDRHMLIVDADNKYLYELWNVFFDGSKWQAGSGAFFDMNTNHRRPTGWTAADAAGLAMLPGLMRYDEVFGPDEIRHAFRVAVTATNGYVYPASHWGGSTTGALPMGARLRLKATKDLSGYAPEVQKIFRAMKTHGLIVADNAPDVYVSGTFDTRWVSNPLYAAFASLKVSDFEVVQLGYGSNQADLSITKTDGQTTAVAGQPIAYTIVAANAGPAAASGATVVDGFPAAVTGVTWTCAAAGGASCIVSSGSGNINRTVNLPSGGSVTFVAMGTLSAGASGTLSNTATVSAPSGLVDPVPANNTATDTDTILQGANISVTKTDGQTTAVAGQPIAYTIVASNAGPNAVSGVTVSDPVPASLLLPTWTCVAAGGASCTTTGSGDISDTIDLPVGGTATYTLSGTLSSNPPSLSNTATVTLPAGYGDPNPTDNSATDADLILYPPTEYYTVAPCRLVDTRNAPGPSGGPALAANSTRSFPVTGGACGIPSTATAVSVNLTAVGAVALGHLILYRGDAASAPLVSNINFAPGVTRANNAVVPLAQDGTIKVKNGSAGAVHLVLDVNGYFQ